MEGGWREETIMEAVQALLGSKGRMSNKAKTTLSRLVASRRLTMSGLKWLIVALDPFHDTEVDVDGYPDSNTSRVINQCVVKTAVMAKPATLTTSTWDAHVFFNPISACYASSTLAQNYRTRHLLTPDGVIIQSAAYAADTLYLYSGYNAMALNAGHDWLLTPEPTAARRNLYYDLAMDLEAGTGYSRLISCGMEIINTSATLYESGSIYTYRSPSMPQVNLYRYDITAAEPGGETTDLDLIKYINEKDLKTTTTTAKEIPPVGAATLAWMVPTVNLPPTTVAEITTTPNTQNLNAKGGLYLVGTMEQEENPFNRPLAGTVISAQTFTQAEIVANSGSACYAARGVLMAIPSGGAKDNTYPIPWNNHGCIITGLTPESTLQVTVKYCIEKIPSIEQAELMRISKCSPTRDPLAIEIYQKAICRLPVGCPVNRNPWGEWFDLALEAVVAFAPKIGAAFGPRGAAIGAGAAIAAQVALEANMSAVRQQQSLLATKGGPKPRTQGGGQQQQKKKKKRKPKKKKAKTSN